MSFVLHPRSNTFVIILGIIGTISVMDEDFGDVLEISINHNENTINNIELSQTKCSLNVVRFVNAFTVNIYIIKFQKCNYIHKWRVIKFVNRLHTKLK